MPSEFSNPAYVPLYFDASSIFLNPWPVSTGGHSQALLASAVDNGLLARALETGDLGNDITVTIAAPSANPYPYGYVTVALSGRAITIQPSYQGRIRVTGPFAAELTYYGDSGGFLQWRDDGPDMNNCTILSHPTPGNSWVLKQTVAGVITYSAVKVSNVSTPATLTGWTVSPGGPTQPVLAALPSTAAQAVQYFTDHPVPASMLISLEHAPGSTGVGSLTAVGVTSLLNITLPVAAFAGQRGYAGTTAPYDAYEQVGSDRQNWLRIH